MDIAIYPADASEEVMAAVVLAGGDIVEVRELSSTDVADADVLVVELADEPMRRLRVLDQIADEVGLPVLVVADVSSLALVERSSGVTDFVVEGCDPTEFGVRLRRLKGDDPDQTLVFKDLELNPLTYQAALSGRPLDLTYMEYELLRFLVENQGRVWSREQLLSKVWGYDYYGGARTVDVHVRRVRAKIGEERASWITTVRSVGYRFG